MTDRQIYHKLVRLIKQKGIARPKRHGEYVKLHVYDDYYLEVDTWNNSIDVIKSGKYYDHLGIDFGGFKCNITMVKFWLAHI